ncbi:MAG: phage tail protein [Nitrospiraceae bacterium]|nr:phage tail protein [Nitrospiraceae bacterium]
MSRYGLLNCHFSVEWGGTRLGFVEVTGLDIHVDVAAFREGDSPDLGEKKMPGLRRYSNIVLKRVVQEQDNDFYAWINTQKLNTVERRDVTIRLLNEQHQPVIVWKISNAFPVRYSGPTLNAQGTDVAMEELELAHEGLSVERI